MVKRSTMTSILIRMVINKLWEPPFVDVRRDAHGLYWIKQFHPVCMSSDLAYTCMSRG